MGSNHVERRVCERFVVPNAMVNCRRKAFPFKYLKSGHGTFQLYEMSRGGLRFGCPRPFKVNARVSLEIIAPGFEEPLVLSGTTRWSERVLRGGGRHIVGVEFDPYGEGKRFNDASVLERIEELEEKYMVPERASDYWEPVEDEFSDDGFQSSSTGSQGSSEVFP